MTKAQMLKKCPRGMELVGLGPLSGETTKSMLFLIIESKPLGRQRSSRPAKSIQLMLKSLFIYTSISS